MMNTHARSYNRVSTITNQYSGGSLDSVVKQETWSYAGDKADQIGNLKRVVELTPLRRQMYRALVISNDPSHRGLAPDDRDEVLSRGSSRHHSVS